MRRLGVGVSLLLGQMLAGVHAFAPALWFYRHCIIVWPERRAMLSSAIGSVYERRGDHELAIKAYSEAAALEPNHAMHSLDLGCAYEEAGDSEKALESFERAQQIGEDFSHEFKDTLRKRIATLKEGARLD